jgi:hypothetical protein
MSAASNFGNGSVDCASAALVRSTALEIPIRTRFIVETPLFRCRIN